MEPIWDPMAKDFYDKDFNSYDTGIGKSLPISKQIPGDRRNTGSSEIDGIQLYVQGIPNDLTEDGIKNLFSKAGNVIKVKKMTSKKEGNDTYGFVTMTTTREAELAIRKFDNFKIQDGRYRLQVKLAKSEAERQRDKEEKAQQEAFVRGLPSERMGNPQGVQSPDAVNLPSLGRASQASKVIHAERSPGHKIAENGHTSGYESSGHGSTHSAGSRSGRSSGYISPSGRDTRPISPGGRGSGTVSPALSHTSQTENFSVSVHSSLEGPRNVRKSSGFNPVKDGSASQQPSRPCTNCGQPAGTKCSACKVPYCSRSCQQNDWAKHRLVCRIIKEENTKNEQLNEFEGRFDVDLGDELETSVVQALKPAVEIPSPHTTAAKSPATGLQKAAPAEQNLAHPAVSNLEQTPPSRPGIQATRADSKPPTSSAQITRLMYKDAPKEKLVSGDQVMIMSLESPVELWIVNITSINLLDTLKKGMDQYYETTTNAGQTAYLPEVGQICVAKWVTGDQGWYRGRVDRIQLDGQLALTFIDYGNKEEISAIHIRRLETQFASIPVQASCCTLQQADDCINITDEKVLARCKQVLASDALFTVKVHGSRNDKLVVEIISKDGKNAGAMLVEEGILKPVVKDSRPCQVPAQVSQATPKQSPKSSTKPDISVVMPDSQQKAPQTASQPKSAPSVEPRPTTPTGKKPIPPPYLPTAAKYLSKLQEIVIEVVTAPTPSEFWAQVISDPHIKELPELTSRMDKHYSRMPRKQGFTPIASKLYASKFEGEWYRAQVLDFNTTHAFVLYLDYGNRERVDFALLHSLESDFTSLPFQAVRFALYGVRPADGSDTWSKQATSFFHNHLAPGLKARVCDKDDIYTYIEIYMEDGETLNDKLVNAGHARKVGKSGEPIAPAPSSIEDLPKLELPSGDPTVMVVDAPSPLNIVVNLLVGELQQSVLAISQAMSQCQKPAKPHLPAPGELVVAQFAVDKAWYRAKVREVRSPTEIFVYFVDYGNTECVSSDVVIPMPEEMKLYPALGVICRLTGITGVSPNVPWNASLFSDIHFSMKVVSKDQDKLEVDLVNVNTGISINKQLLETGVVTSAPAAAEPVGTVVSVKDLDVLTYTPGTFLEKVCVTDASSPTAFTIQDHNRAQEPLSELEKLLAAIHENYVGSYVPAVNELVATRFMEDNMWYRATVDKVQDQTVSMTLVDYGNKQTVKGDAVNRLDHALLKFPRLGLQCSLAGIGGVAPSIPWDTRHLMPMEKMLQVKIVSVHDGILTVELLDENTCVNRRLLELGVVTPTDVPPAATLDDRKKNIVIPVHPLAQQPKPEAPTAKAQACKESPRPQLSDISEFTLPEDVLGIVIYYTSPEKFYIHVADNINDFAAFSSSMQALYSSSNEEHVPVIGEVAAVYCSSDKAWYRAEIKDFGAGSARVFYVDYGNDDSVPASDIRKLQPQFLEHSRMAVTCKFAVKFSEKSAKALHEKIKDIPLGFLLDGKDAGMNVVKDVFNAQSGVCVLQEMREQGLLPTGDTQLEAPTQNPVAEMPAGLFDGRLIKNQHLPDSNVKVKVVHVENPGHFFLHVNEDWCQNKVIVNLQQINIYCNQNNEPYRPKAVGEMVCGKMDIWYRTVVKEILPNDMYLLDFVDYGNIDRVPGSDIRLMLKEFMDLDRQGIPCRILNLRGTGPNGDWTKQDITWFQATFPEKRPLALKPSAKKEKVGEVNCIDLILEGGDTASQLMLREKRATLPDQPTTAPTSTVDFKAQEPPRPQRIPEPAPTVVTPGIKTLDDLPKQNPNSPLDVVVIVAMSPEHFYCQEATPTAQSRLETIKNIMLEQCQNVTANSSPSRNQLCAVYHELYKEWYRAVVLSIAPDGITCNLQFIDYGDMAVFPATVLRPLPAQLLEYPPQAFTCSLSGVSPVGGSWQPAATDVFRQLAITQPPCIFTMAILGQKGHIQLVTLINQSNGCNVGQEMQNAGMASVSGDWSKLNTAQSSTKPQPPAQDQQDGPPALEDISTSQPASVAQPPSSVSVEDMMRENKELKQQMSELQKQMALITKMFSSNKH